jgi:hypothetical protein
MRVLVCGGRDFGHFNTTGPIPFKQTVGYKQYEFLKGYLDTRLNPNQEPLPPTGTFIIAGGARGADRAAIDWAVVNWVPFQEYPANWEKYGKRAGYLRNVQMLEEGKPDLVIAFPGGKGTAMMINLAKGAGVPVEIVTYD